MELSSSDQIIGDLTAELEQARENLYKSELHVVKQEKEIVKLKDMVIILIDKDIHRTRCCE